MVHNGKFCMHSKSKY